MPYGPGPGSILGAIHGASVADSPRTMTTCTSWSENFDPTGDGADEVRAHNPARSEDVASHMRREQARNVATDVRRQIGQVLDQAGRHAAQPLGAEPDMDRAPGPNTQDPDPAALPNILEHEPAHTRESLHAIISRFNSLETKNGAVGTLLNANSYGMAFANVPTSMIIFTSRPLTAILTRWPMMVFLFAYALMFLFPSLANMRTAVWGRSISMAWLQVHEVKVYESVFPTLGSEETRLTLVDAGIYDYSVNRRLIPGCNTTLSESSFEIRCAQSVEMQGIWLHVVKATNVTTKQASPGGGSRPYYKYAGIEYAHTIGPDMSGEGGLRSPGIEDVYNVMGTGQTIRGRVWEVRRSQTSTDGIYRLPVQGAQAPLLERSAMEIFRWLAQAGFGLMLLVCFCFAVTGMTGVAKHACVLSAVCAALLFFVFHFIEAVKFLAQERRMACVLFGLARGFRIDTTCGTVPSERNCLSCDTALAVVLINLAYSVVWFPLAWNMWREKNFHSAFCCCVPVGILELTLFCIHKHLVNQPIALISVVCVSVYLVGAHAQFRLMRRLAEIMRADKDFYDRWWQTLSADPNNRRVLAQLSALVAGINKRILHSASRASPGASTRDTGDLSAHVALAVHDFPGEEAALDGVQGEHGRAAGPSRGRCLQLSRLWTRGPRAPAMPCVRQMTCKPADEVDLTQFFAPADVLYDNLCDVAMNYSFRPNPVKLYSRRQREGAMEVCGAIDTLYLQAACLRPILSRKLDALVCASRHASRIGGSLQTPLKDAARAVQKALRVYGNDCSLLLDICRELLVFDELEHLYDMLLSLEEDAELKIVRIKNRLDDADDGAESSGYRDVMINIRLQNRETTALNVHHHIAELQLVLRAVYERRSEGSSSQKSVCPWSQSQHNKEREGDITRKQYA
jgi:hypothetical protein